MKTFLQWAEDKKYDLSDIIEGAGRRQAGRPNELPSSVAGGRGQYPTPAYFAPSTATAYLNKSQEKNFKDKAPADGAP